VLVSHDWHLVELVADRLWLVDGGTVRPFDDDLEAYRRRLLARDETSQSRAAPTIPGANTRRAGRREAAERRLALEPLRRKARSAEATAARLAAEQQALDRSLAQPGAFDGAALGEALKRRAELERLIGEAEAQWFEAEAELERLSQA
jgi:ATP-binding cassette subfamily F protein 3